MIALVILWSSCLYCRKPPPLRFDTRSTSRLKNTSTQMLHSCVAFLAAFWIQALLAGYQYTPVPGNLVFFRHTICQVSWLWLFTVCRQVINLYCIKIGNSIYEVARFEVSESFCTYNVFMHVKCSKVYHLPIYILSMPCGILNVVPQIL